MKKKIAVLLALVLVTIIVLQSWTIGEEYSELIGTEHFNKMPDMNDEMYAVLQEKLGQDVEFEVTTDETYIPKSFLKQYSANSRSNIYFGFTLEELDKQFDGQEYFFTLGENDETVVKSKEEYLDSYDDLYERLLKKLAVAAGVIVVTITIKVIISGIGEIITVARMAYDAVQDVNELLKSSKSIIGKALMKALTTGDFSDIGEYIEQEGFEEMLEYCVEACGGPMAKRLFNVAENIVDNP